MIITMAAAINIVFELGAFGVGEGLMDSVGVGGTIALGVGVGVGVDVC